MNLSSNYPIRLMLRFFSGGIREGHTLEDQLRIRVINIVSVITIVVLTTFGTIALAEGASTLGFSDLSVALVFFITQIYLRLTGKYAVVKYFWVASTGMLFVYLFNTGGVEHTGHLWAYIFPLVAAFLLGPRRGAYAISALMASIVVLWIVDYSQGKAVYSIGLVLRYVISSAIIAYATCYYEHFRQETLKQLAASNLDLDTQIAKLKEAEEALRRNQEELEKRVENRTDQLKTANEELRKAHDELEMRVNQRTEELKRTNEALVTANRAKSDFLANMSHELRTPLNHIMGFTELIVDKQCGDLNEVQEEYLNDVLQSSGHLLSLINDILDLSKVEAGKLELQTTEVHLRTLSESGIGMVKEQAMKHRIEFLLDIEDGIETIRADERKLKQIIYNLLSNAVKFTPDGGLVTITARQLSPREGQWFTREGQPIRLPLDPGNPILKKEQLIAISVQDTGIGINGEDLQRIFAPFEQGDGSVSRRYQGTGLGLSLTRRLVELHGGRIWAESPGEGKGSTFIVIMPG